MSHAEAMDAAAYWRQYEVKIAWDAPKEIIGTVEALRETRRRGEDGNPVWVPRLAIRQDDGVLVIVDVDQTRLRAELVLSAPAIGERVCIRYGGPEEKAAAGMSPAKRFRVWVDRPDSSQPPAGAGSGQSGDSEGPENAPEAGK